MSGWAAARRGLFEVLVLSIGQLLEKPDDDDV
jgi:hypothetical protein